MLIEEENIVIRLSSADDEGSEKLIQNSPDLGNMSETRIYPKGTPTEMYFRIEYDGELAGQIKFTRIRWLNRKAELSIIISNEFQGKGIGTTVMKKILDFAFEKMNLHRLEAEVIEFNKVSEKLIEKLGFKKEGVLREAKFHDGKYWDIYRYGLLRLEYQKLKKN